MSNPLDQTGAASGDGPDTNRLGLTFPLFVAADAPDLPQRPPPGARRLWLAISGGTAAIVLAGAVFAGVAFAGHHLPFPHPAVTPAASQSHASSSAAPSGSGTTAPSPDPAVTPTASPTPAPLADPADTPTASPPQAPSPTAATSGDGMVMVATGVRSSPETSPVLAFLNSYFAAINNHDYQQYVRLLDQQMQSSVSPGKFYAGSGSTTDSAATLTQISPSADGDVAATVVFTSHQEPSESPDHTACTNWTITIYLEPRGAGYVMMLPPPGYEASYQPCQ